MNLIKLAQEAGLLRSGEGWTEPHRWGVTEIEKFAALVIEAERNRTWPQDHWTEYERRIAAIERNKIAVWMMERGYATGHGDTVEDLLTALEWQVREACAQVCEARVMGDLNREDMEARRCAEAIRKRGKNKPSGSYVLWDNTQCNSLAPAREQAKRAWDDGYESGRLAEREACAHVCETAYIPDGSPEDIAAINCAKAIRKRGEA